MFEWVPRTLSGSLAHVGGAHGVDLAGLALGQVLVLSKKVHCMSLSSIHILYYHTPTERLKPNPEPWYGFTYFHCTEVVHVIEVRLLFKYHLILIFKVTVTVYIHRARYF